MNILWIPHTGWHIPQRAHQFVRGLAARGHTLHVTDWVADFSTVRDYLSPRYLRNFIYHQYRDGVITVHGIPRISPAIFSRRLRQLNTRIFSNFVQMLIQRYAIDALVGTFVVPPPDAPRVVFDLFDDNISYWSSYGHGADYASEIHETEQAYLSRADAVVAASSILADKAQSTNPGCPLHLIPNGIDVAAFSNGDGAALRSKLNIRGKLVGLLGNHDKTGELEKVVEAADQLRSEQVTFLIAGRGKAIPTIQARVERHRLDHIKFLGYVPMENAPDIIHALDVGLCPYAKTPGADASSPMRLLMYLAAGLPSVCTDLDSVRRVGFQNVVLVNDDSQSLVQGIRKALQLGKCRPPQIESFDLPRLVKQYEQVLTGATL